MSASALFLTRFSGRRAGTRESNPSSEESLVPPPPLPLPFLARSPPLRARALSALVVSRKGKGARVPSPFAFILGTRRFVTSSAPATGTHAYPPPAVSCAAPIVPRQSQSRTYEVQDTTAWRSRRPEAVQSTGGIALQRRRRLVSSLSRALATGCCAAALLRLVDAQRRRRRRSSQYICGDRPFTYEAAIYLGGAPLVPSSCPASLLRRRGDDP